MNLLIVDDELWSRQLIRHILKWHQYGFKNIYEAEDGQEALDVLEKHDIDLTITDMKMSGMDGVELLENMRKKDYQTEVIVMSGYDEFRYIHVALKTKAIDYLLKPIVKEELIKAVRVGMDRIQESRSYNQIEHMLQRDDIKKELNKYYEYKSKLFKSISSVDEALLIKHVDLIDEAFFLVDQKQLGEYIKIDLGRLISKFEQDYEMKSMDIEWIHADFDLIKDRLFNIFKRIKETKVDKKLDILEIQKYIDTHFSDAISLSDIADMYYVSKEHLSRLFKKEVHMTVQNYITEKRIENAKRLLRRHQIISISTISMMSGYLDVQYFYRVFKRLTHMTPQAYKEANINIVQ